MLDQRLDYLIEAADLELHSDLLSDLSTGALNAHTTGFESPLRHIMVGVLPVLGARPIGGERGLLQVPP